MENRAFKAHDNSCLIQRIHASPHMIVLSVTGGGAEVIGELLRHGNGSATLLEAIVPYHEKALLDLIGKEPDRYCSGDTARAMAMAAFRRALELAGHQGCIGPGDVLGIGATCKLAKAGERSNRTHEIHIASQSLSSTSTGSITLTEHRSREEEEELASNLIVLAIARACGIESIGPDIYLSPTEQQLIDQREATASHDTGELLLSILQEKDGLAKKSISAIHGQRSHPPFPKIVFAGSFNPCHKNHAAMARIAYDIYGSPVTFEISLANVDKPPIDFISLENRLNSLKSYRSEAFFGDVCLTNAPLFADKAMLFPGCRFLIGSDTLNRIFNERYYREGESTPSLLKHFKLHDIRFLVFQRQDVEFSVGRDVFEICDVIPCDAYTDDGTSSRKLRKA